MSTIDEIERAVTGLSQDDLSRFREWFLAFDAERWGRQIEQDAGTETLDEFAEEALMERVQEGGGEIVITKRNHPAARPVPVREEGLRPFVGRSRGVITATRDDLIAPLDEDWEVDADL